MKNGERVRPDVASVARALVVHPGFLFIGSLVLAGAMGRLVPLSVATRIETRPVQILAGALFLLGGALIAWALSTFRRHATSPEPGSPPTALLTGGPFRFSRNPMYVALLLFSLALAILAGSLWFFAATAALATTLDRIVIAREEKVMRESFGDAFEAYRARVRRWG